MPVKTRLIGLATAALGFGALFVGGAWTAAVPTAMSDAAGAVATGGTASEVKATASDAPPPADIAALRYFARHQDHERLAREIARLKALYPGWSPPADPMEFADMADGDPRLDAMWKLYGEGRFAELRAEIARRRADEPEWQTPADLLKMLAIGEGRERLTRAFAIKQYKTVIETAAATSDLMVCANMDVLWDVAESFVRTDRPERGRSVYDYILETCDKAGERLATVQKAAALLPYADVDGLMARERTTIDGKGEFDAIGDDLARRFVAAADGDDGLVIADRYVARMKRLADAAGNADDPLLYGWYLWLHGKSPMAGGYFAKSRDLRDSASAAQGLALTEIAAGRYPDAEATMYGWRLASDDAMATYLAATAGLLSADVRQPIPGDVLARIADVVTTRKDAVTAQQFGWYARRFHQLDAARQWFDTALMWKTDDEPSAYGLALTLHELKNMAALARIKAEWGGRSPRIAAVGTVAGKGTEVLPRAQEGGAVRWTGAIAKATPAAERAPARRAAVQSGASTAGSDGGDRSCPSDAEAASPSIALRQGWCRMNLKRPSAALSSFGRAAASPSASERGEAAYGKALAYLRLGLINEASLAATAAPMPPAWAGELQTAILGDRAVAAFKAKRYRETLVYLDQRALLKAETLDLMVLRGYAYLKLGRTSDARQIFTAVAATGNRDAIRALNETEFSH